jgi:hypothetical protein
MADDPGGRGPSDHAHIDVDDNYELKYWCALLGCDADELRAAVAVVGSSVNAVRLHLYKSKYAS